MAVTSTIRPAALPRREQLACSVVWDAYTAVSGYCQQGPQRQLHCQDRTLIRQRAALSVMRSRLRAEYPKSLRASRKIWISACVCTTEHCRVRAEGPKTPISPWQIAEWDVPTDPVWFCLQKQVVQPLNGDPFIGMLETPVTSAPIVANYLSNLPVYRTGVSPLLRGVEIGLAHGFLLTGPFIKVRTCLWQEQVCE